LQSKLSLAFRSNLTRYVHDLYLYVPSQSALGARLILRCRNDRRNYYKLSIGLGAMVAPSSGTPKAGERGGKAKADEVVKTGVAAGGIDQYVFWLGFVVVLLRSDAQVLDDGYRAVL
jgi:ATP-binding cassette subfamily D (ALD) long-chain fatty acid import protein